MVGAKGLHLGQTDVGGDEYSAENAAQQHGQPCALQDAFHVFTQQLVGGEQAGGDTAVLENEFLFHIVFM